MYWEMPPAIGIRIQKASRDRFEKNVELSYLLGEMEDPSKQLLEEPQ